MDFLSKSYGQLVDLFRSMTPGARITAALLLVVTVVCVAWLFNEQVSGPDAYLMGGEMFTPNQLTEIESALGKANLDCKRDGARIRVPRGQEAKCMAALAEAGALPADFGDYMQRAVTTNSWLASRAQQEALAKSARNRDLQNIINNMKGVARSAVQIAEETQGGLRSKKVVSASVSIQSKGNRPLEPELVTAVRELLSGSVSGLKREAVTVVDLNSGRSFAGTTSSDKRGSAMMGDYADLKQRIEHDFQTKILNHFSYIPGVIVGVNVELQQELSTEKTQVEYETKAVVYESNETTTNKTVESAPPAGRPGVQAQGGVANQAAAVTAIAGNKNNEETSSNEQRKAVPMTQEHTIREGRRPELVTASIAVPVTYYEEVYRQKNRQEGQPEKKPDAQALADLQASEKAIIEDAVLHIIKIRDRTADAYPQVHVSTYYPTSMAPPPEPSVQDSALAWLGQYWSTLGMTGMALVSLVMLRSMVRGASSPPQTAAAAMETTYEPAATYVPSIEPVVSEAPIENTALNRLKRRAPGGPSLQDELAEIVRDDPDAAVSILRTWIGAAS